MKFILHNLHMIWSRFRSNGWVLAEMFLVFIVMWFLCDSLGCMKYTFYRPLGYDINHVYSLTMIRGGVAKDTTLTTADKFLGILRKLEQEPVVEAAALCYWSLPMSGNNSDNSLTAQDSISLNARIIKATGGYTKVFRFHEDSERPFAVMPTGDNHVMLSEEAVNKFRERIPTFSLDTPLRYFDDTTNVVRQEGVIGAFRTYRYGDNARWFFFRLDENQIKKDYTKQQAQIVFRVKAGADSRDFRANFIKEMASRLDTDNVFVADAVPYTEQRLQFEIMNGDTDNVNGKVIVVLFLLVNVFLGLIGTFWFRTRRRRGEMALRLAMGSTKMQVFRLLMGEGLLLLALVTIPAMIICFNVGFAEFTIGRAELIATWPVKWSFGRFLLGSLGAWLLIAAMVTVGIWFPARQAMKIQPAEALHEE